MSTPETMSAPALGQPGELCAGCGVPLAEDQRYCLNCGYRRADSRVPYTEVLRRPAEPPGRGPRPLP
jgi:predicted amidophosphoribosyltransferase